MEYQNTLRRIRSILVIDWPTKEVPEQLAVAGFDVTVRGGPGPLDYAAYTAEAGSVSRRPCACPERIDLIYAHRPLGELSSILAIAKEVNATVIWMQSGLTSDGSKDPRGCWIPEEEDFRARHLVQTAGMAYFSSPYVIDAVQALAHGKQ